MLYRIRADLSFEKQEDAEIIFDQIHLAMPKATSLSKEFNMESSGYIDIHKCYHDENPAKPCEPISKFEVAEKIEVK